MVVLFLILLARLSSVQSKFLIPSEQSPFEEVFQYDTHYEYVFSSQPLEWEQAEAVCRYAFAGVLATLETDDLLLFAAEAMSESRMKLDGLWVALQRTGDEFKWLDVNITIPDDQFVKCGNSSLTSPEYSCGAVLRANHTVPCLVTLRCDANRGFICKRLTNRNDPSTHHGWIRVGQRLYKIFTTQVSYENASKACMDPTLNAYLAVVDNYEHAQRLGRYLLVGRPSLERVWIGARWDDDFYQYEFEAEPIVLLNYTDPNSKYPPWRRRKMRKPLGCLLLDRHLSNVTYFIESNCKRLHSYMCYKMVDDDKPVDVCNVGDYDWKIYYNQLDWFQAMDECKTSAPTGRLPVLEEKDLKYFVYIMETAKRYLLHVWLGAYFDAGVWTWSYTKRSLPRTSQNGYPPWVVNASYDEYAERHNLCLNIDRENALVALYYGTLCSYPQNFICQFDRGTICPNTTTSTESTKITDHTRTTPNNRTLPWILKTSTARITTTRMTRTTSKPRQTTTTAIKPITTIRTRPTIRTTTITSRPTSPKRTTPTKTNKPLITVEGQVQFSASTEAWPNERVVSAKPGIVSDKL